MTQLFSPLHLGDYLDYIDKDKSYDGLIIYTDGYAPVPKLPMNKKTRIVWLFNHEDNYNKMKESLKHIGKLAFMQYVEPV